VEIQFFNQRRSYAIKKRKRKKVIDEHKKNGKDGHPQKQVVALRIVIQKSTTDSYHHVGFPMSIVEVTKAVLVKLSIFYYYAVAF